MKVEKSSKIIIVGGHEQACNILEFLVEEGLGEIVICVVRQDDNGEDEVFPSLLKRSKEYNIPTLQPKNLNSNSVIRCISRLEADIVLSLQNNMIFSSEWVSLFKNKLGIVNVHYSPLPKYAGFWPEMWAIYNEEKRFAVTMHYVTDGVDTGPVIAQRWFDINDDDTRRTLYEKSSRYCFDMLCDNLCAILNNRVEAEEQQESNRSYYPKSLPNDGFLELSWSADKQERFIRAIAFPGYPGPKIKIGDDIYTILKEDLEFYKIVG